MLVQFNLYIWPIMNTKADIYTFNWAPAPATAFAPARRRP